ncbi:hypothetical protein JCM6882_009063 [Rhodosporidiobolus microsporus]
MSGGLHRRNSSALYQQLTPQPGVGDITGELESYSSATPRPRTGSFAAEQRALEDLEEKEGFIPDSRYDLPGSGRRSAGRTKGGFFGWKAKLVMLMLLGGGIGAAVYFLFYRDTGLWWLGNEKEEVVGWTETAAVKASQAVGSAATGVKNYAAAEPTQSGATYYSNEGEYDDSPYDEEEEETTTSDLKVNLSKNTTSGSFSSSVSASVARLLQNGTLAAYQWHETLPSQNGTTSLPTYKKQGGGRVIVVGDIHGTHTSLLRLLKRLSFSPSQDTLIHAGDVLAKSSLNDSLTTVALLRRFKAKGVRGNHDQKVIEWRKWMEAYGPLDRNGTSSSSSKALKGVSEAVAAVGSKAQSGFAAKEDAQSGFRKVAANAGAAKLNAGSHHPRRSGEKVKRGWLDWLTGGSSSAGEGGSEELLEAQNDLAAQFADEEYGAGAATAADSWADEDAQGEGPGWDDLKNLENRLSSASASSATSASKVASTSRSSSSSSSASSTTTTPHRRPFGRPTSLTSSSSTSTRSSSSARPSSTDSSRIASFASLSTNTTATSSSTGALTGPLYSWLSPSLSSSELKKLSVEVPEGWEWGGEHFEIARHLSKDDVEYLEGLPLTLWVEDIKSWVVHAGMAPWSSLTTTLSRLPSTKLSSTSASALPSLLTSTSPLEFSPSSSLSKLLSRSSRTALLLEPLNTDPYTLLNMRTLHSSSAKGAQAKVKGPATGWTASSKGKKAGKGSRPWWAVWEEGMEECAELNGEKEDEGEEGKCEEAGVIYGHWAGQGLQVQPHSIGLDTGCVYGRRLSALVVPLSSTTSSPLGATLSSASHRLLNSTTFHKSNASYGSLASASASASSSVKGKHVKGGKTSSLLSGSGSASDSEPTSTSTSTRVRPGWHGGMEKVTKSVASALSSATSTGRSSSSSSSSSAAARASSTASSSTDLDDDSSSSYYREDTGDSPIVEEEESKPWWRPWKRSEEGAAATELEKRGPPQGRPGVAPWSSSGEDREEEELLDESEEYGYGGYEEDEEDTSSSSTTTGRGRPTKTASLSSTSISTGKGRPSSASSSSTGSSPSSTATGSGRKLSSAFSSSDVLEDDDEQEALEVASLPVELSSSDEFDAEDDEDEGAFEEQEVHLAATGARGQVRAWVVSVDCGGDIDTE